jgi:TonB family protein
MRVNASSRRAAILLLIVAFTTCLAPGQTSSSDRPKDETLEILTPLPPEELTVFTKDVLPKVISQTKKAWFPIIPSEAQPPQLEKGKVGIEFELHSDGKITNMKLAFPSGKIALDRAAWGGLTGAQPFSPFPPDVKTEMVRLRFFFSYNMKLDEPTTRPHQ